jgi:DNA polymerase III epsilon subunit-like protein
VTIACVFDTETTGLPVRYDAAFSDVDNWPYATQVGFALVHVESGRTLWQVSSILKLPEGVEISEKATEITGLTADFCREFGSDEWPLPPNGLGGPDFFVCHNAAFDVAIFIAGAFRDNASVPYTQDPLTLGGKPVLCTKQLSTEYCNLPGKYAGKPKWPTLQELHTHLFGKGFDGAHDALADVQATARCFVELVKRGVIDLTTVAPSANFNLYSLGK